MDRRLAVAVALCAALTACGGDEDAPGPQPTTAPATSAPATSAPPTSAPPTSQPTSVPTTPAPTDLPSTGTSRVVLQPAGLSFAGQLLSFGQADPALVAERLAELGQVTQQQLECGQGARTGLTVDGFTALLDGSSFVGWTEQGASGRVLTTSEDLGVGSTLADVQALLPTTSVSTGPAGVGFTGPSGFSGLLDGDAPTSLVTALSAGETCGR